ncbi:hypothetical protein ACFRIB_28680 [Streptomyces mirabilis]|uniref:hypothetical protein n=1 Tax=Streptomyces mirabilis TaxID=68239 RepID=UPI0036873B26
MGIHELAPGRARKVRLGQLRPGGNASRHMANNFRIARCDGGTRSPKSPGAQAG